MRLENDALERGLFARERSQFHAEVVSRTLPREPADFIAEDLRGELAASAGRCSGADRRPSRLRVRAHDTGLAAPRACRGKAWRSHPASCCPDPHPNLSPI